MQTEGHSRCSRCRTHNLCTQRRGHHRRTRHLRRSCTCLCMHLRFVAAEVERAIELEAAARAIELEAAARAIELEEAEAAVTTEARSRCSRCRTHNQ